MRPLLQQNDIDIGWDWWLAAEKSIWNDLSCYEKEGIAWLPPVIRSYKKTPKNVGRPQKILGYFRKIIEPHGFWGSHTFEHQGHSRIHRRAPEVLVPAHQSGHQRGPQLPIACCDFQWYSKIVPINVGSLTLQGETVSRIWPDLLGKLVFCCAIATWSCLLYLGAIVGGYTRTAKAPWLCWVGCGSKMGASSIAYGRWGDSVRLLNGTPFGRFCQTERKPERLGPICVYTEHWNLGVWDEIGADRRDLTYFWWDPLDSPVLEFCHYQGVCGMRLHV